MHCLIWGLDQGWALHRGPGHSGNLDSQGPGGHRGRQDRCPISSHSRCSVNLNCPCGAEPGKRRIPGDPDQLPGLVGGAQYRWPWTFSEPDCHAGEGGCCEQVPGEGFSGGTSGKESTCQYRRQTWVRSLGQEDPLEKGTATHSSVLAWRIPWTREPGGLQSMGLQRVGHD